MMAGWGVGEWVQERRGRGGCDKGGPLVGGEGVCRSRATMPAARWGVSCRSFVKCNFTNFLLALLLVPGRRKARGRGWWVG